jgi:hypothetical protein
MVFTLSGFSICLLWGFICLSHHPRTLQAKKCWSPPQCSGAGTMTQGTRSTRVLGSYARPWQSGVSGRWTSLSQTRQGLAWYKSRGPRPGNRTVVIETLSALGGKGEAAEAWATFGKQVSKTESCLLSPAHLSYSVTAQREVWNHYPHRSSNCRRMARVGRE